MDLLVNENGSTLESTAGWSLKVVRRTTTTTGTTVGTLTVVQGSNHLVGTRREDLEQVQLTTASRPTRALDLTVLQSSWDLGVQQPDGRHVTVETGVTAVRRHGELKDKDLLVTTETVVSWGTLSVVATVTIVLTTTLGAREDDELGVGVQGSLLQDNRSRRTTRCIGVTVTQRVTEAGRPDTRTRTTVVVKENNVVTGTWGVVRVSLPRAGRNVRSLEEAVDKAAEVVVGNDEVDKDL